MGATYSVDVPIRLPTVEAKSDTSSSNVVVIPVDSSKQAERAFDC